MNSNMAKAYVSMVAAKQHFQNFAKHEILTKLFFIFFFREIPIKILRKSLKHFSKFFQNLFFGVIFLV